MLLALTLPDGWPWVAGPLAIVGVAWLLRQFRIHMQRRKAQRQQPPTP